MEALEKEIIDLITQAHNKYLELNPTHPSDIKDWEQGVHRLQDILGRRLLRRDYPKTYVSYTMCPKCKSTGTYFEEPCGLCDGKGLWVNKSYQIKLEESKQTYIKDCIECKGTGTFRSGPFSGKCDICNGSGKIQIERYKI